MRTPAPITALAYSPDGKLLAVGAHKIVHLIDPAAGDVIGQLTAQTGKVTALAFSHDGRRLAVASSTPGTAAEVFLYLASEGWASFLTQDSSRIRPERVLAAHKDTILDLAFSRDDRLLATTGYDRLIKLWDVESGKELRTLKDHSDAVYSLAFSPDGRLLGSAAADRAVKVWDVARGTRLYTLGEATDWLYAIAWSPDGRHLAAAGVDKSIRVWAVSKAGGKLVHSVFAHDGAVTRLVYAADGKTLYSVGEDNTIKAWDTAAMIERKVYPRQPEAVLALAVRSDGKQLALGRYDGTAVLLDEASGNVLSEPMPIKPKPPVLTRLSPPAGLRGQTIRITLEGKYLDTASEIVSTSPGVKAKLVQERKSGHKVQADLTLPEDTLGGVVKLGIRTPAGQSAELPFIVDLFPTVSEVEPNDSPTTGQRVTLPVSIAGAYRQAGSVDYFRFDAHAGQQIGVQIVTSALGSKLEPVLQLSFPGSPWEREPRVVAESTNGLLGYQCDKSGMYAIGVRDRDYRGGHDMQYRLHVGTIPVITAVFPLGLQRGTEAEVCLQGVNLGAIKTARVTAAADAALGSWLPITVMTPHGKPLGDPRVVVGEFPEIVCPAERRAQSAEHRAQSAERRPPGAEAPALCAPRLLPVPGTANGCIEHPGLAETWRFAAKKGQRLIVEVNARRLGSPLDSYLEILDAAGKPVPRATLRCVAKTYVAFRDHDSSLTGIRIESWNELTMNDFVWVGNELLQIHELPKNPDDDCHFFGLGKQRIAYLDTTPTFIPHGVPMYKVTIHPPGSTFPPNGFPVIHLDYRNDDGGPGYGKDSRIFFDAPADGEYQVRIGDARGQGSSNYAYRLTVRPPRPSFEVHFNPIAPAVWRGGAVPITVSADRSDGFDGTIHLRLENVPAGFSAPRDDHSGGREYHGLRAVGGSAAPTQGAASSTLHALVPQAGGLGGHRGAKSGPRSNRRPSQSRGAG